MTLTGRVGLTDAHGVPAPRDGAMATNSKTRRCDHREPYSGHVRNPESEASLARPCQEDSDAITTIIVRAASLLAA